MRLKDVFEQSSFEDVYECLIRHYKECREIEREKVYKGFSQVQGMTMAPCDDSFILVISNYRNDGIEYYDVSGYCKNDNQLYSLVFEDWEKWICYPVDTEVMRYLSFSEIAAHCLWEMTWQGWTYEERKHNIEVGVKESALCDAYEKIEKACRDNQIMMTDDFLEELICAYDSAETDHLKAGIEIILENMLEANLVSHGALVKIQEKFEDEAIQNAIAKLR